MSDAYERDREAFAVGADRCEICGCDPCVCFDYPEPDEPEDEIAATRAARRECERALFVNGGLRNFLTARRGA